MWWVCCYWWHLTAICTICKYWSTIHTRLFNAKCTYMWVIKRNLLNSSPYIVRFFFSLSVRICRIDIFIGWLVIYWMVGFKVSTECIPREIMNNEREQGAVSIRKTVLPGMAIPMLKIRRHNGRLIFNMEIAIRRQDGLYIETGPWARHVCILLVKYCSCHQQTPCLLHSIFSCYAGTSCVQRHWS